MYYLVGADGKTYGPVAAEQIRQWIREGRAAAKTMVRGEHATEWRPLEAAAEFAELFLNPSVPPHHPSSANTASSRASDKIAAGVCGILLGSFGVHKFILGYTRAGLIMLLVTLLTCGVAAVVMSVIGLIEGIVYLTKTDEEFVRIYVDGRKEWF
jgi:TM2 domain-containing membrane protein YozV